MITPYRRLRRTLRLVHYYSADRNHSAWSQAVSVALLVSLPLAVIAAIVFNVTIRRVDAADQVTGQLVRDGGGELAARIVSGSTRSEFYVEGRPMGEFTIWVPIHQRGWPIVTSNHPQQAQLDLNLYDQANTRSDVRLAEDSPIRLAIDHALVREGQRAMIEAYRSPRPPAEQLWLGWAVCILMLWAILAFLLPVSIQLTRFFYLLALQRRATRAAALRARGLCVHCGYNLRGLEFHARCPECGKLVE